MSGRKVPIQSLIDHIKTACDVDPWAKEMAEELLEKQKPVDIELEGGGSSWWYVCGECHATVDDGDRFCRHCGRPFRKKKSACDGCLYKGGEDCLLELTSDRDVVCVNGKLNLLHDVFETWAKAKDKHVCVTCKNNADNLANGTKCPIQEHYVLPKDGFCHLWEGKENDGCKF